MSEMSNQTTGTSVPFYETDFNFGWPDTVRILAKSGAYLGQPVAVHDGEGNSASGWIERLEIGHRGTHLGTVRCDPDSWKSL